MEYGYRPFLEANIAAVTCHTDCRFITFRKDKLERLLHEVPQVNYYLRKQRAANNLNEVDWLLGDVEIY